MPPRRSLAQRQQASSINPMADPTPGRCRLWLAAYSGQLSIVQKLLSAGVLVDLQDGAGYNPLLSACERGHLEVVSALLSAGA